MNDLHPVKLIFIDMMGEWLETNNLSIFVFPDMNKDERGKFAILQQPDPQVKAWGWTLAEAWANLLKLQRGETDAASFESKS